MPPKILKGLECQHFISFLYIFRLLLYYSKKRQELPGFHFLDILNNQGRFGKYILNSLSFRLNAETFSEPMQSLPLIPNLQWILK